MNIKLLKRLSVMATSALGVLGVLFVLLETFGVHVFGLFHKTASASVVLLLLLIIILIAVAGVCAYSFYLAYIGDKVYKARMITLKGTKEDVVLIKQETLDEFVASVIGRPEGITDISVATEYRDMALDVTVTMKVNMDADIASMTNAMQSIVREQLETVNGIKLGRVAVIISGINVPENIEGMKMPWADKKDEEMAEEIIETEEETNEAAEAFEVFEQSAEEITEEPIDKPIEEVVISEETEEEKKDQE